MTNKRNCVLIIVSNNVYCDIQRTYSIRNIRNAYNLYNIRNYLII